MRKVLLVFGVFLFLTSESVGQSGKGLVELSKIPVPQQHYQPEYTFDKTTDTASWLKQKPGLHVAFGSTDELYMRCEVPVLNQETLIWSDSGWYGERLNAQVLVWSPDTVEQIRFKVSNLVTSEGKVISKENIKLNLVRYVVSDFPYNASGFSCDAPLDSAWLMPDRFESFDRFDLPGRTVRPVWISVEIPAKAATGKYTCTIEIKSLKETANLKLNITIQNQVLPSPHDWKFRLDLWQNPWVVASYYHVKPWSDEHLALLKKHLKHYADAGGKYITTYCVHSPWSGNSYTIEETMIDWVKKTDDTWKFDYSDFDQYVKLAMEAGIDKAITIYTPVPGWEQFRYLDEKSGNFMFENWAPTSKEFKAFWNIFLTDLKDHLTKKGWFNKTYLGINESSLEYTIAAAGVIRENSKEWKITYAGDWHPELSALLDDYSPIINSEPKPEELKARSAKGFTTTYYVCCTPAHPNNFVFSPPAEGRYIGWYAAAYGYDGFLRWAYDAWPADALRDARHTLWPAGDCFLVYPGGNSCIRFEKLREGIVDYEKIMILRELASKSNDKNVKKLMNNLEVYLATLTVERDNSKRDYNVERISGALRKGKKMISELSYELGR